MAKLTGVLRALEAQEASPDASKMMADRLGLIAQSLLDAQTKSTDTQIKQLGRALTELARMVDELPKAIERSASDVKASIPEPEKVDLQPLERRIETLVQAIARIKLPEVKIPEQKEVDLKPLLARMDALSEQVGSIELPDIEIPKPGDVEFKVITRPDGFPERVIARTVS